MSNNPEGYIYNTLNTSVSKQAHSFSKADRFFRVKRIHTQVKYEIPSTKSKRSCSFGYGNKVSLVEKRCSPPPGTYEALSSFTIDKVKLHAPAFGPGRQQTNFGSYIKEAQVKGRQLPSPDRYNIVTRKQHINGYIGSRLKTQFDIEQSQRNKPGPGSYNLESIEIANSSSFFLSTLKKCTSPKYFKNTLQPEDNRRKKCNSAFFYQVQEKQFGRNTTSKFRNVTASSFGKSKRMSFHEKQRLKIPGFKYSVFSEFGSTLK